MVTNNSINIKSQGTVYYNGTGAFSGVDGSTAGKILTSNGTGVAPSFQSPAASSITIDGDTGSATGNTLTLTATTTAGSSTSFSASGTTIDLNVTDSNLNTIIGGSAGNGTISGGHNTSLGDGNLTSLTSGTFNSAFGFGCLNLLQSGGNNIALGAESLNSLVTGSSNIGLGIQAGTNYTTSESSNIVIGNIGTAAESHVIRIGTQGSGSGQQNLCFVAGITGATPTSGNTPQVVLCDNTGNLAPISSSTSGFVLTSNGSATPSFQARPFVQAPWTDENSSFAAVAGNGYFVTATATATLPASPSQGNIISFAVDSASGILTITANTSQTIQVGTAISASAGTCVSNKNGDSITLVFRSSDKNWMSIGSPQGTWTVT